MIPFSIWRNLKFVLVWGIVRRLESRYSIGCYCKPYQDDVRFWWVLSISSLWIHTEQLCGHVFRNDLVESHDRLTWVLRMTSWDYYDDFPYFLAFSHSTIKNPLYTAISFSPCWMNPLLLPFFLRLFEFTMWIFCYRCYRRKIVRSIRPDLQVLHVCRSSRVVG